MKTILHSRSTNRIRASEHRVVYGLHYISGIALPYFAVTVEAPDHMNVTTGAAHDDVLARHPDLADLVALHLANANGVPTHAVANAWYWWSDYDGQDVNLRRRDGDRLDVLARHLRLPRAEIDALDLPTRRNGPGIPREFVEFVESQRERWQAEADAAIDKYDLHDWRA